jgi:hypothetical protein
MTPPQAALRTSALVIAAAFPHHAAKDNGSTSFPAYLPNEMRA